MSHSYQITGPDGIPDLCNSKIFSRDDHVVFLSGSLRMVEKIITILKHYLILAMYPK